MPPKHEPLQRTLEHRPADEAVSLTMTEIAELVGGLLPSSDLPTWWANSQGHVQARSWLQAGRRVQVVRPDDEVVFSAASRVVPPARPNPATLGARGRAQIANGVTALDQMFLAAGYPSITAAVAAHTVFLHPATVAQTHGSPCSR